MDGYRFMGGYGCVGMWMWGGFEGVDRWGVCVYGVGGVCM